MEEGQKHTEADGWKSRTVDGNGDSLGELEAILASEGGDLAKRAGLEVLSSASLLKLNLDDLEVEAVGLSDRLDGGRAGVVLQREEEKKELAGRQINKRKKRIQAYRLGEKSAESHCD